MRLLTYLINTKAVFHAFPIYAKIISIITPNKSKYNYKFRKEKDTTQMTQEEKYMKEALNQAKKAFQLGEVPIGCVIVYKDKIIGRGYNRRNTDKNTLSHAEIKAIKKASKKLGDWRLEGCTMYVTLEPCQMCSGAIVQSRMDKIVIGCMNPKAGCAGSILNLLQMSEFNHQVECETGVLKEACSQILKDFFKRLREENKRKKLKTEHLEETKQTE